MLSVKGIQETCLSYWLDVVFLEVLVKRFASCSLPYKSLKSEPGA